MKRSVARDGGVGVERREEMVTGLAKGERKISVAEGEGEEEECDRGERGEGE